MPTESLSTRAATCIQRVNELRSGLEASIEITLALQVKQSGANGAELRAALGGTSIYATGSVGRLEASDHSDLDVFVISGALDRRELGRLEQNELTTDLIRTARVNGFPRFSRDGEFLTSHPLSDLIGDVGKREDDYHNRFTARMLLLLESRCLYGDGAYEHAVEHVLSRYWPDDKTVWLPFFLFNDLVRYWKTVCLNYEGFKKKDDSIGTRHLQLLKLRYSRMWTCFSGLAYLLAGLDGDTIPRLRAREMVRLTPMERMQDIAAVRPPTRELVKHLVTLYESFLDFTSSAPKVELEERLGDDSNLWSTFESDSLAFGQKMHLLMNNLTASAPVQRFLLI